MNRPFFSDSEFTTRKPDKLTPNCNACGLFKLCKSPKMPVAGRGKRKILVVGEAPGKEEDKHNRPFIGPAGQLLQEVLEDLGVDLFEDCWVANAARCRPPQNKLPVRAPVHCRPLLVDTLKELKPELVIPLGKVPVASIISYIWKSHDKCTINKWVGWQIPSQKINAWVCPNFHPSHILRSKNEGEREHSVKKMFFQRYLKRALELEGRPWDRFPEYRKRVKRIYDPREAAAGIRTMVDVERPVAFDYENTMLKPDSDRAEIVCCSVYDGKVCYSYPWLGEAVEATGELLRSNTPKIGANLKHEERWTIKEFGHGVKNWLFDTVLGAHTLDSRGGTTSVKFQAFVNLGMDAYDEEVKPYFKSSNSNQPNRIREIPIDKLLLYCGLDSVVEYHLAKIQMEQIGIEL